MTPEEIDALAVRLVACKHFRPMPGMRDLQGRTWTPDLMWRWNRTIDRPDLSDPATMGCLLALVRKAWGEFGMETFVRQLVGGTARSPCWVAQMRNRFGWNCYEGTTEAEALVAALEAAPCST